LLKGRELFQGHMIPEWPENELLLLLKRKADGQEPKYGSSFYKLEKARKGIFP
jgi:hypothetical protein